MRKDKTGFTLIELLVVVAIMGVLIAILLPALKQARDNAIRVKCASNFHQIGMGLSYYLNDNNGFIPYINTSEMRALSDWTKPIGFGLLQPYFPGSNLGNIPKTENGSARVLFNCPAAGVTNIAEGNFTTISYLGWYQYDDNNRNFRADQLTPGTALGTGLLAFNPWNPWMGGWMTGSYGVFNHNKMGGNILYLDGHVNWRASKDMFERARKYTSGLLIVRAAFNEN
jgi:prepilin-type N-terminal cleavage/methylation domain-containing protein/prepilin-type processing-associated H-X9-DG protein